MTTTSAAASVPVLVVDDEESVRTAIAQVLRKLGYVVTTASSGAIAIELLGPDAFTLMVTDVRMPNMNGVELVSHALAIDPDLAIVMLSGANDVSSATEAMKLGAFDYLMKPASFEVMATTLEAALHRRKLNQDRRRIELVIREEVEARTADLEREKRALRTLSVSVVHALVNAMEAKDIFLRGHSVRVADLGASIAEEMGLDPDTVEHVRVAGHLHDVGKMGIREEVLNKPGSLTPEEFEHVKEHVRIGMEILAPLRHLGAAQDYVQDHHENFDGSGYPRGLAGVQISVGGRILAAADAFDAMTSQRAYRSSMSQTQTLAILEGQIGAKLDARVFAALQRVVSRNGALAYIHDVDEGMAVEPR